MTTIILSDGEPFEAPLLGIFELDSLRPNRLEPFTYKMEVLGKEYDTIYDMAAWPDPPQKPDKSESEIVENSSEWFALNDWKLYEAAKYHEEQREIQLADFLERVAHYILNHCKENGQDLNRIKLESDWEKVYDAMLVPQLTVEILAETLEKSFRAEFEGEDVLTAIQGISEEKGGIYDTLRIWENDLMIKMQLTELEYSLLPLEERARKVCALFLPDLMSALEANKRKRDRALAEANKVNHGEK